jgi:uncharacterized protein
MSPKSLTQTPGSVAGPENIRPVTIVLERLPRRGAEERFRGWAERFVAEASHAPGHKGGSVLSGRGGGPNLILLRFASAAALEAWQRSSGYESLMRDADAVSTAGDESQIQSGLEPWFTLPDMPAPPQPPPKWKVLLTALPVVMLTWVVMPRAARALYHWTPSQELIRLDGAAWTRLCMEEVPDDRTRGTDVTCPRLRVRVDLWRPGGRIRPQLNA